LHLVNGDFSLAIADLDSGTVFLIRDRSGARPLYYARFGDGWIFASEYKALLAFPELSRDLDKTSMQLLHSRKVVPADRTLLHEVRQVPAQSFVTLRPDGTKHLTRYWQPACQLDRADLSSHAQKISGAFFAAVERRVSNTGQLGISLSGGIDSVAMVAAARKARPDAVIRTYTIGDSLMDPEITVARRAAEKFGTEHSEQVFSMDELPTRLKNLVWALEDPIARTESLMTLDLCSAAAGEVDVMLRGDGADGLFGGMARHKILALAERVPFGKSILTDVYAYTQSGTTPQSLASRTLIKAYFRSNIPPPLNVVGYDKLEASGLSLTDNDEILNQVLWTGAEHALPMLLQKVERPHARFSMRTFSPFLDNDLVEAAHAVPSLFKNDGRRNKIVFREAARAFLPDEFLRLPKYAQRVRETSDFCDCLEGVVHTDDITESLVHRGIFMKKEIAQLLRRPSKACWPPEHAMRIWTMILTEYWFRAFIDAD
jgi:asparagine synthase (glutamine-hydrolysing)